MTLEHGGNLAEAARRHGHPMPSWLDLSTGIAPWGYPVPPVPTDAWHRLPGDDPALLQAAQRFYGTDRLLPVAGSVAAIRALPQLMLRWRSQARVIVAPLTFNEHAAAWTRAGHRVHTVAWDDFDTAIDGADVAVVCQPNNPTADEAAPAQLLAWRERLAARGGWLVVDEAFRDSRPEHSVISQAGEPGLVVLRSLGKFFGLAGARVGFVAARPLLLNLLDEALGPWCVSGPAQVAAAAALQDTAWQAGQRARLRDASLRLARLCERHGLTVRRTDYFVWIDAPAAQAVHAALARAAIWTRRFEAGPRASLRIGLPGDDIQWQRLEAALDPWTASKP